MTSLLLITFSNFFATNYTFGGQGWNTANIAIICLKDRNEASQRQIFFCNLRGGGEILTSPPQQKKIHREKNIYS